MPYYDESFLDTTFEDIFEKYRPQKYGGTWEQAFLDPGLMFDPQYGLGGAYGEYFSHLKLDPQDWMKGKTALKERSGRMHGDIETQYGQGVQSLGEKSLLGVENIRGQEGKRGFTGGASGRMLKSLRRSGEEGVGQLSQKRGMQHQGISDTISKEWSALRGIIPSLLGSIGGVSLGLRESSPTGEETRYANADDIYNLSSRLEGDMQTAFVDRANQLISGGTFTYQALTDLLSEYLEGAQGGQQYG